MRRRLSYNDIVARSRAALVAAAQIVHESNRDHELGSGSHWSSHMACCIALNHASAPDLARHHFRAMFRPDNTDIVYWFGVPDDRRRYRARNLAKRDKRVTALLLAAASLE